MNIINVIVIILSIIAFRVLLWFLDKRRVRDAIKAKGGSAINITWEILGPGWIGEGWERIYHVTYLDRDGNRHSRYCKTSMLTGVWWLDRRAN